MCVLCIACIQRKGDVDYHGVIQRANLNTLVAPNRKPTHAVFQDNALVDYDLLEVGVDIGLWRNSAGNIVNYDRDHANIEIKFAKRGNPNTRVIINVHLQDDPNVRDANAGARDLDSLIAQIYTATFKSELEHCKQVDIANYAAHRYEVQQKSLPYYCSVAVFQAPLIIEQLRAGLAAERQVVAKLLTDLEAERQHREAEENKVEKLTQRLFKPNMIKRRFSLTNLISSSSTDTDTTTVVRRKSFEL